MIEEGAEVGLDLGGKGGFGEGVVHELHPPVAGGLVDAEGHVALTQARMAALLDVALRPTEAVNQKIAEPK
ncbi:MAG TPA: hypothetical protein VMB02_12725 [Candidatus Aquilonibacter sp.]|nr:hypothetical protein [Candidatus Aquilonibacter sp.]